ncbi:GntR family transcriptional regulator [Chelativorans salis]|uniref:GntR family transcriptional regulator n=1 Tax=Chelativorans salis TaxID=2978478 RepID=A0ABT2LUQ2_9HYPH|nr:GntR family transcriptional regulator [Chelativorans sp. EGI FJ00035]MCT7378260.1 GntR family transcriptional regulator [Chelativorans sp. EGI FJ00035]
MHDATKGRKPASLPGELAAIDRHQSLGERAYASLKDSLIRGALRPGTKLTMRSVAQALHVSTTPARDAITRLIGEGALVNLGPKTVIVPQLTLAALDEITAIRLALEGLAAQKAAANVTPADIVELERLQERINQGLDESRYTEVLDANKDFHFLIYRRSGMVRLVIMIETLWLQIGPSFNDLYPEFAQSRTGVSNHMWALHGLQDGDAAAVRAAIENDIRSGYRHLSSLVE